MSKLQQTTYNGTIVYQYTMVNNTKTKNKENTHTQRGVHTEAIKKDLNVLFFKGVFTR